MNYRDHLPLTRKVTALPIMSPAQLHIGCSWCLFELFHLLTVLPSASQVPTKSNKINALDIVHSNFEN